MAAVTHSRRSTLSFAYRLTRRCVVCWASSTFSVLTWRAECQDGLRRHEAPRHWRECQECVTFISDADQPDQVKPHQPQSSHAVTNCGRRYDVKAGESGSAHVGPRLESHPETSPRLGRNFTACSWLHDGVCCTHSMRRCLYPVR